MLEFKPHLNGETTTSCAGRPLHTAGISFAVIFFVFSIDDVVKCKDEACENPGGGCAKLEKLGCRQCTRYKSSLP